MITLLLFFLCFLGKIDTVIYSGPKGSTSGQSYSHPESDYTIQQVTLTQKGYIQFLKYTSTVPTLTDYTFCIWFRSNNLSYNHPLLSYSRHEEERVIRVWVSEKGQDLSLEIMEHQIFKVPVNLVENVWYHVCQSWSAQQGAWNLFLNGKLKSSGFIPKPYPYTGLVAQLKNERAGKRGTNIAALGDLAINSVVNKWPDSVVQQFGVIQLKGVPIKGGGDLVVGQEYTDFDKGLDDGIEGDVFGFNFVLSSTSTNPIKFPDHPLRRRFGPASKPLNIYQSPDVYMRVGDHLIGTDNDFNARVYPLRAGDVEGGYSSKRRFARTIFQDMMSLFNAEVRASRVSASNRFYTKIPSFSHELTGRRISNEVPSDGHKTLGVALVELSFDCGFKKGAPLSGKGVLISWTKSPVRVFGGAILKNVQPFCRKIGS